MSYKEIHESFVSGHNGTSLFEVSVQTTLPAAGILTRDLFLLLFGLQRISVGMKFMFDFVILVVPMILALTIWNTSATLIMVTLYLVSVLLFMVVFYKRQQSGKGFGLDKLLSVEMNPKRPYISNYRAFINIGTAIAILAVDFPVFPRRYAKAETYGSGLMDSGVGSFVISNAIVSLEARGKSQTVRSVGDYVRLLLQSVKSVLPLLVLGGLRVLAIKMTGYPEHVSEYGVHWNFFLTLAAVKVLATAVLSVCGARHSGRLAVIVALLYQAWLTTGGLSAYLQWGVDGRGGRQGVIDANREGVYSCLGYLAIYLAGVRLGQLVFSARRVMREWLLLLLMLALLSVVLWLGQWVVNISVETTSRRLANAAYVLWMLALNTHLMAVYLLGDLAVAACQIVSGQKKDGVPETHPSAASTGKPSEGQPQAPFCLATAVNFNGLLYFLLANVLTGLVNMSVATVYASNTSALAILTLYMLSLSLVVSLLCWKQVKTKVW